MRCASCLASGNAHKLTEFARILAPHAVLRMPDWVTLPPEGVTSFSENAREKALALARALAGRGETEAWCVADDSGLEVEALGRAPGVSSARYAGVDGPGADAANVARLLEELAGCADPRARRARFVCAVCAVSPELDGARGRGALVGRHRGGSSRRRRFRLRPRLRPRRIVAQRGRVARRGEGPRQPSGTRREGSH